jgi:hypothetical protein
MRATCELVHNEANPGRRGANQGPPVNAGGLYAVCAIPRFVHRCESPSFSLPPASALIDFPQDILASPKFLRVLTDLQFEPRPWTPSDGVFRYWPVLHLRLFAVPTL